MTIRALFSVALLVGCAPASAPTEKPLELRGLFTYFADAAIFEDCGGRGTLPVVAGWGPDVERAYLESRPGPGQPLLATLRGRIVSRAPEPGLPKRAHLEITTFGRFWPGSSCEAAAER